MPHFGSASRRILAECHPLLQRVLQTAIDTAPENCDFSLIEATRGRKAQMAAYNSGRSKAKYGQSAHNYSPSVAVDFLPYPFPGWNSRIPFERVAKHILATAKRLKIPVRWGGDWNGNGKADDSFYDGPHIELTPWRNYVGKVK